MSTKVTYCMRFTGSSWTTTFHGTVVAVCSSLRVSVSGSAMALDFGGGRRGSVHPFSMLADEVGEAADRFFFRDVELHGGLADVKVDLAGRAADVAEVRVRHFARAVDDAAHHRDPHALEVAGGGADFLGGVLEIEQRAAAARAGDVVGFENTGAGGLQDVVGEPQRLAGRGFTSNNYSVA